MDMQKSKILITGESYQNTAKIDRFLNENNLESYSDTDNSDIDFNLIIVTENNPEKIKSLKFTHPMAEIIVIADKIDTDLLESETVHDWLKSDYTDPELLLKLKSAAKHNLLRREINRFKENIAMTCSFDNFVGSSKPIQKIKETIKKISATEIPVYILGANGTGKDLVARIIHHHSECRKNKLIEIDCNQSSGQILDTTLFNSQNGAIKEVNGGTLYLKNIDKMPLETQKKFYDFCQTFKLEGANNKISLRIISSSTTDLNILVKKELFLEELYYQLAVIPLQLPTLTKRTEDIPELANYLLRRINYDQTTKVTSISRDALELLLNHNWPGNVAELEAALKRATQIAGGKELKTSDIIITGQKPKTHTEEAGTELIIKGKTGLMDEGQKTLIIKTLHNNNWNYSQTAQELGIGRTTLWRKVKKYNLKQETV